LFGTFVAGFGTFGAMFHVFVLFTFCGAGVADIGADTADLLGFAAAQAHELRGAVADGGAFHIKLDTFCHHLHVFFLETGRGAMITDGGTTQASVYALLKFVVAHNLYNLMLMK
jgi:hypothetical protein